MEDSSNQCDNENSTIEASSDLAVQSSCGNEIQKRLFAIKLKMNQARKANKQETELEFERITDPKSMSKQKFQSHQNDVVEPTASENPSTQKKDSKFDEYLNITAADSQKWQEKQLKKQNNIATFGWQAYTSDAAFRSYEKSLKKLPNIVSSSNEQTNKEAILSLEERLLSRQSANDDVPRAALDRLTKHIVESQNNKDKISRRRMHLEGVDIDYINEDNAKFNKKIKRAFDKYTVEIRQNLERGTAL